MRLVAVSARISLVTSGLRSRTNRRRRAAEADRVLASLPTPPGAGGLVSVVVVDGRDVEGRRLPTDSVEVEVVAVDPIPGEVGRSSTSCVVTAAPGETLTSLIGRGIAASNGETVCLLGPGVEPLEGAWLARLRSALGGEVVAATPAVLHPHRPLARSTPHDLLVRALGVEVELRDGAPVPWSLGAGTSPMPESAPVEVFATTSACLLVNRDAYERVGGLGAIDDLDSAVFDLCARLRGAGGRVVCAPASVVVDHRPVQSRAELTHPIDSGAAGWQAVVDKHGPALLRGISPLPCGRLRIALTCAAPSEKVAPRWGDWHFASAFARALERMGHLVRVQTVEHAEDAAGRACDLHVVLRGLAGVRRTLGQRHVLWVISHPDIVDDAECDDADLVLVASERFAAVLRERASTPVEVMLQATDPERFHRTEVQPRLRHGVAFVGKSRDVMRSALADAISAGLRPAIFGSGWENLVDPSLIVSGYVPNERLAEVYSSVGVLLNDHWEEMRAWGFVSNRIFDALACGTPVVSDYLPEIAELFGDSVATYRTPEDLRATVEEVLQDPEAARRRAETGRRIVLEAHTFDARARELIARLEAHGYLPVPRGQYRASA